MDLNEGATSGRKALVPGIDSEIEAPAEMGRKLLVQNGLSGASLCRGSARRKGWLWVQRITGFAANVKILIAARQRRDEEQWQQGLLEEGESNVHTSG